MDILTEEEQAALIEKKVEVKLSNENYLRDHPELKQIMSKFMLKILQDQPPRVRLYTARYFTSDEFLEDNPESLNLDKANLSE